MDATTFPLPLPYHVVLCVLGCVFFFVQFIRLKKPYQLMMAIAMPASLLIYIQPENKILFYVVGLLIGLDMLLAVIISIVLRIRSPKKEQEADAK